MKLPLVGQAYLNRSLAVSAQECVNLFPEKTESEGRSVAALHGTPGLKTPLAAPGTGPIRGMHVMGEFLYVISGNGLYSVTKGGIVASLGAVLGDNRMSMSINNASSAAVQQLCMVDGGTGYIYDTTGGLVTITDVDFHSADVVDFVDTYFIFNWTTTHKFFISNSNDGTAYTSTDFGEKLTFSDNLVTLIVDHKEVWLFGETSIEVWFNQGDGSGFPFVEIESAYIERGCGAVHSVAKIDDTVFFLGEDLIIYAIKGYQLQRISTHAIEFAIKSYLRVNDAFAFNYTDEGHKFYVLTFPSGSTWVFDTESGMWHERRSLGLDRWRVNAYAYFNNKHYVGDFENGNIYEMDLDTYTENGTEIQRRRATTYIHADSEPVYLDWLQVVIESGTGLTTGQGKDPQAMLQYSDDSGKTWSSEKWRTMGKIGVYSRRVKWSQLGRFYQRVFRLIIADPIKVVLVAADVHFSKGSR
jgi:hypothetical protein